MLLNFSHQSPQFFLIHEKTADVHGYEREEYTHMAMAVNVHSGTADVGLGILAAAKALGLNLIPLMSERYDLVVPESIYEDAFLDAS